MVSDGIRYSLTYVLGICTILGMMKKILFCVFAMCIGTAMPAHAYVDRGVATVRVMNKAAGKVSQMTIPVGETREFEKITMTVRACKQTDPFEGENFFMFIEIAATPDGRIFSGWMDRNEPGQNPLQNADYDVWLVGCE